MNMQRYDEENPNLVNSIVCAIDILGFSQMIVNSCSEGYGNKLLKEISYLINKNKQCIIPNKYSQGKIKIYTDNMIVGYPINDDGEEELDEILDNVSEYQFNLSLEGLFVRGGVSVGEFYINEDIVFGPALLDAHNTESELACYPRIVLDYKTVNRLQKYINYYDVAPQQNKILIDSDGQWFLNYLNTIFKYYTECDNEYEFEKVQIELLLRHKVKIEEMLELHKKDIIVWDKYVWTANYHNYFCDLNFPNEKQLKISRKTLLSWPRQISNNDV
ncbi:hypothetical protein FDC58_04505 [Clostridium botulinum]|uniref:hypothetical protein n=1 Tax=Clostridium TaxID=1485 RepID=UPI0004FFF414|nr:MULTISPECIES: hypothetical protein [unclassified Clostridium]AIY80161.1 hypothetical protein U728_3566 [Clostridium botulinum 202F]KAI3348477.1 hypothetical protein CIT17_01380 [Clostridium botulinum]KFX58158.1 hypothetical protein KU40_03660 [Clostridium botulinum]KFX59050.1 hypothetical protein KU41_07535 [Clostridium botulinum]KON12699.1 hypothetical protein ACP50_12365 [Clostridium botulinum]